MRPIPTWGRVRRAACRPSIVPPQLSPHNGLQTRRGKAAPHSAACNTQAESPAGSKRELAQPRCLLGPCRGTARFRLLRELKELQHTPQAGYAQAGCYSIRAASLQCTSSAPLSPTQRGTTQHGQHNQHPCGYDASTAAVLAPVHVLFSPVDTPGS